jgi:hypothetical protein
VLLRGADLQQLPWGGLAAALSEWKDTGGVTGLAQFLAATLNQVCVCMCGNRGGAGMWVVDERVVWNLVHACAAAAAAGS